MKVAFRALKCQSISFLCSAVNYANIATRKRFYHLWSLIFFEEAKTKKKEKFLMPQARLTGQEKTINNLARR